MKTVKTLRLLLKEIQDPYVQENFYKLKLYLDNLEENFLTGEGIVGPQGPAGPAGPPGTVGVAEFAGALKVTRIAADTITIGDAVYAVSSTTVDLADFNGALAEAMVFGFALNAATAGQNVDVLILGVLTDPIFSVFSINSPLFLDSAGGIKPQRHQGLCRREKA